LTLLLLDEMFPVTIARQLSEMGCDTEAASARVDLRGSTDAEMLEIATQENRAIVTDNIQDFVQLSRTWIGQGRIHPGIILVSSKTFPMTRKRSQQIAAALIQRCKANNWPPAGQFDFLINK
jgi:predicted nuclease of predicted toxin-antitoxin system